MIKKENSILFLGDVAPYHPYSFRNDCMVVLNLECPIVTGGVPATGKIILGARENHLGRIFNSKLLCVSLANNHILDYGREGLESTIASLEKNGIKYFGLNNKKQNNPLIVNFNDLRIAFLSAVCESTSAIFDCDEENCLSPLGSGEIIGKIKAARQLADRVIVYLHWGEEDYSLPSEEDMKTAGELVQAGADIVVGSHAHSPQPAGKYRNGIIAYNLGNFIMPKLKKAPSYFDPGGNPGSLFTGRKMLWNRISWGLMVDMTTMDFRIRKFMQTGKRVIELPFTPFDKFISLPAGEPGQEYARRLEKHQKSRRFQLRMANFLADFVHHPHMPQKLIRKV